MPVMTTKPKRPIDRKDICISVSALIYDRIGEMALEAGISRSGYASRLLEAAYAARCRPTGDRDLDSAVARVAVLWARASIPRTSQTSSDCRNRPSSKSSMLGAKS